MTKKKKRKARLVGPSLNETLILPNTRRPAGVESVPEGADTPILLPSPNPTASSPGLCSPAGRSKKKDKCKNTQMYPLSETQYCPCDKYNAQPVGNWSDCILPEAARAESLLGLKVQGDVKECGQGYRYQVMVCYDQDSRLVETSRCNSHGEGVFVCVCARTCIGIVHFANVF